MAEAKTQAPVQNVPTSHNISAREVLAQRLKNAQAAGSLTPKLQRQFDRIAGNIVKGNK